MAEPTTTDNGVGGDVPATPPPLRSPPPLVRLRHLPEDSPGQPPAPPPTPAENGLTFEEFRAAAVVERIHRVLADIAGSLVGEPTSRPSITPQSGRWADKGWLIEVEVHGSDLCVSVGVSDPTVLVANPTIRLPDFSVVDRLRVANATVTPINLANNPQVLIRRFEVEGPFMQNGTSWAHLEMTAAVVTLFARIFLSTLPTRRRRVRRMPFLTPMPTMPTIPTMPFPIAGPMGGPMPPFPMGGPIPVARPVARPGGSAEDRVQVSRVGFPSTANSLVLAIPAPAIFWLGLILAICFFFG